MAVNRWLASFPKTSLAWLAFIRIGVGLAMLSNGINKLGVKIEGGQPAANWFTAPPLRGILDGAIKSPAVDPLYRGFLESAALPNAETFAALVTIGELLVGLSLTLGLLTRLGGFGGAFLHLNYMLMKGLLSHGGYTDRLFFGLEIVLAVTAAGYVLGLDGVLRASVPAWLRALMSPTPDDEPGAEPVPQRVTQPA
jgi:thiosulfate dehydrogenase [quinone] large subunit